MEMPAEPMMDRSTRRGLVAARDQQQANMDQAKGKSKSKANPNKVPFVHEQKGL